MLAPVPGAAMRGESAGLSQPTAMDSGVRGLWRARILGGLVSGYGYAVT